MNKKEFNPCKKHYDLHNSIGETNQKCCFNCRLLGYYDESVCENNR
jgi:hypothetical protein